MWKYHGAVGCVLSVLPLPMAHEIENIIRSRRGGAASVKEIRVRLGGASLVLLGNTTAVLSYKLSRSEMDGIIRKLTDFSLYAYRDTILRGYIPMGEGIRVGICGQRYSDNEGAAVSDITALIFRIPTGICDFSDELYEVYRNTDGGLLIYSPPGGGKTTGLRALAAMIGERDRKHVVVIDERCEFSCVEYKSAYVDILRGYPRGEGIELAVRTLSPEIIIVDELMGEEISEIKYAIRSGIPIIATAHAGSLREIYGKKELSELLECGVFNTVAGIFKEGGSYTIVAETPRHAYA